MPEGATHLVPFPLFYDYKITQAEACTTHHA